MLRLDVVNISVFRFSSFGRLLLSGTTPFTTLVTPAVEMGTADSHAQWPLLLLSLQTHRSRRHPAATTCDIDHLEAGSTRIGMACLGTLMTASQELITSLAAMRHHIVASLPRLIEDLGERGLAAGACGDHIWRLRTMRRPLLLWMAGLFAGVLSTVE